MTIALLPFYLLRHENCQRRDTFYRLIFENSSVISKSYFEKKNDVNYDDEIANTYMPLLKLVFDRGNES